MSTVCLIASDTPLPFIDMRILTDYATEFGTVTFLRGFAVGQKSPLPDGDEEAGSMVNKEYVYDFSIEADDTCLEQLKLYLAYNVENGREVDIWSLRLGGDPTKHYTQKIPMKHVKAGTPSTSELNDEVDWYKENFIEPERVKAALNELSVDNIRFVLENSSVCLTVKK